MSRKLIKQLLYIVCFTLGSGLSLCAQESSDTAFPKENLRSVKATYIGNTEIILDGRLEEKIWKKTPFATGFKQRQPDEGSDATEKTEVYFLYDDEALYVGGRMYSDDPSKIQAQVSRRDNSGNSQRLIISLDTFLDRRTARNFSVTASGVRVDYFQPEDRIFSSRDFTFDPVWTANSNIDSLGWTAEMRIPFSQLRFNDREEQVWGLNINRFIPHKNEDVFWELVPQDETGWASRFGLLEGIKGIVPEKRFELLPFVASDALFTSPNPQNPFLDDLNLGGRVGGNIEYGLGPNFTLNATINPDFGQVEIDPAQVNLSAFETIFSEKRPFFTEGQQLFDVIEGGRETYFFSRRIGAPPSLRPNADFVEQIDNTSILGASKITGRLPSGLSIGAITAVTAREKAGVFDLETDETDNVEVEPLTNYSTVRLDQEFGTEGSTAGFIFTSVYRDLDSGTPLAGLLHENAISGAGDWNLRFGGGKYEIKGDAGFSHISGSKESILRTQRTSTHYFQRPDASHVSIDSSATSLTGFRSRLEISKNAGEHWLWELEGSTKSPEFEVNDAGILFEADETNVGAELTFRENTTSNWYQEYNIDLGVDFAWNYGGIRKETELELGGRIEWKNFWSNSVSFEYSPRSLSDRLTRGGPLMKQPGSFDVNISMSTDRSKEVSGRLSSGYSTDELGGYNISISGQLSVQPGGKIEYSINPRYSKRTDKQQFITSLSGGPSETFGTRYIFSTIDRTTLATQFRINYAFNPDFTLELFAEPFVSTGSFHDPGQLPEPGALQLDLFDVQGKTEQGDFIISDGEDQFELQDPDFLIKSFRSNMVLRYEWRPGSTFFLVWQADFFSREKRDRFARPGDLLDTFGVGGDNIIALKFEYWLPL